MYTKIFLFTDKLNTSPFNVNRTHWALYLLPFSKLHIYHC